MSSFETFHGFTHSRVCFELELLYLVTVCCRLALDFQSIIQQWFETTESTKNWTKEYEDVLLDGRRNTEHLLNKEVGGGFLEQSGATFWKNSFLMNTKCQIKAFKY